MPTNTATFIPKCIRNLETSPNSYNRKFNPAIKDFYVELIHSLKRKKQITAQYDKWTEQFKVCKETLKNWLRFFEKRNLIELGGGRGRGRKFIIKFTAWVQKKIELATKSIKTISKERIFELEAQYLKTYTRTKENPKKTKKVFNHSFNKKTSIEDAPAGAYPPKTSIKKRPETPEGRKKVLERLPSSIKIQKGSRYWRYVMEDFRRYLWLEAGINFELNKVICSVISKLIEGQFLGWIRYLKGALRANIHKLIEKIELIIATTPSYLSVIREIYGVVNAILNEIIGEIRKNIKRKERKEIDKAIASIRVENGFAPESPLDINKNSGPQPRPAPRKPNTARSQGDKNQDSADSGYIDRKAYFQKLIERHGKEAVLEFLRGI